MNPTTLTAAGDSLTQDSVLDTLTSHSGPGSLLIPGDSLTFDSVLDTLTTHSGPGSLLIPGDSLTVDSVLDTLTMHSGPGAPYDDGDSLTRDSVLDTLTAHSGPVVVGLDWEPDGWRVSSAGAPAYRLSKSDMLDETFPGVDYIVVEQAHMRERDVYSVAQVYTAEELAQLKFRDRLRLFPGMPGQLAKAARDVGNTNGTVNEYGALMPDKERDAETMSMYAAKHPARLASWKAFKLPGEDPSRRLWPARAQLRQDLQDALNPLRTAWNAMGTEDKYQLPEVQRFCALVDRVLDDLPAGVAEQFGLRRTRVFKNGNGGNIRVDRMTAALTLYLSVYTREGELRTRPDGEFIGIRFILDTIGLCNSYKPNMARSQLTYHGMRHYKGGRDGGMRSEYMRNLRHFLAAMRDAAGDSLTQDSVLDTLTRHSGPSSQNFDGDSLTQDSVLDTLTPHSGPVVNLKENL